MVKALIIVPLVCLVMVSVFTLVYLNSPAISDDLLTSGDDVTDLPDGAGSQNINGTVTDFEQDVTVGSITFTMVQFAYSVMIAGFAVIVAFSITILGSTLGSSGGRAVGAVVFWYGLYFTFSVTALLSLMAIPVFGLFLYFVLSLAYGIGVYETVG